MGDIGRIILCVLAVPAVATAAPKPAPRPDPRIAEAKTACGAGDVQTGIRLLAELYTATSHPTWLFNQARCYQVNAQPTQALARFKEYLRKGTNEPAPDRELAERYIKELEAELAAPKPAPPPAPAPVVSLPLTPPPAPEAAVSAPAVAPRRSLNRLQVTGLALGGTGVLFLGAGAFFTYKVQATEQEVNEFVMGTKVVEAGDLKDRDRSGARYELLQWISYGVGVAAVAAGVTAWVVGGERRSTEGTSLSLSPFLGPGTVGSALGGSF